MTSGRSAAMAPPQQARASGLPHQPKPHQHQQQHQQQQQPPEHQRAYANWDPQLRHSAAAAHQQQQQQAPVALRPREYANVPPAGQPPSGLISDDDARMNYMDIDYSTGRGVPASRSSVSYAQLGRKHATAEGRRGGGVGSGDGDPRLLYVELDFRTMAALAATAQAERELPPTGRTPAAAAAAAAASAATASPKSSKLSARLRLSVVRSLSRLSLRQSRKSKAPRD